MGLFLRAFKPSKDLTLAERTKQVYLQQQFISDELKLWNWFKEDKTEIDVSNGECYELIYKGVKKGMNAKRIKITRYIESDTPDMPCRCFFLKSRKFIPQPFIITHRLGFYDTYSKFESISMDNFENAEEFNNLSVIKRLVLRIIKEYKPQQLYVSGKKYFHDILKPSDDTPWTGWFTYLDNSISLPKEKPKFCEVEKLENGTLFCTSSIFFDDENSEHVNTALKLSRWFKENGIKT